MKLRRILTHRGQPGDYEAIEYDGENFFWRAVEANGFVREAFFPVDLEWVRETFKRAGREFDPTKLSP